MEIVVEEHIIASKPASTHLGVMIDDRLCFKGHVDEKTVKAVLTL